MTRRDFLRDAAAAGVGAALAGCRTGGVGAAPAIAGDFVWGALLHLGLQVCGDWTFDGKYPTSREEAARTDEPWRFRKNGAVANWRLHDYFATDMPVWDSATECARREGLNLVIVDVSEAYACPSHPEIWVKGAWDADRMRAELARLRGMGMEPIPKLNFSTAHDIWLRQYHYMTSTPKYYEVVADIIRDVCEVFGWPRYFHVGFDEETPAAMKKRAMSVVRQGELWWHDFNYCVGEVERHGARAIVWSDKICSGKDEFLRRMSKGVLQMPWYYGTDFSERSVTWNSEYEKATAVDLRELQKNLPAVIGILADAGFDILPCSSNWESDGSSEAMLSYCRKRVTPERLKGFLTAPWFLTLECQRGRIEDGLRLFGAAKRKVYPS